MENQYMPKQYIEFKCRHQRIERTDDFFVVGGSQRYLYAKFDFCSDWSELQQYAVFTGDLQTYRIPIVDGECEVPWEMLLTKRFFVGCEAGQRITSNAVEIKVHPCGAPEETGAPRKPTPTLQSQIGNLSDLQTEAKENLVDAINEVYGQQKEPEDVPGLPGEDGGYYIPTVSQVDKNTMNVSFTASKEGMPGVPDQEVTLPSGADGTTPHIGDNGNWFIGDVDTGVPSRGKDAPQEAVLYTPQTLTPEQQAQARQNIGACDEEYVNQAIENIDLPTSGSGYEKIIDFTTTERVTSFDIPLDKPTMEKLKAADSIVLSLRIPKDTEDTETTTIGTVTCYIYLTWLLGIGKDKVSVIPCPTTAWHKTGFVKIEQHALQTAINDVCVTHTAYYMDGDNNRTITHTTGIVWTRNLDVNATRHYLRIEGTQNMAAGTRFVVEVKA